MIKPDSINSTTKKKLLAKTPSSLKQQKQGLDYISGASVISILNDAFGFLWSWKIDDKFIRNSEAKVIKSKFVNGKRVNLKPEEWIREEQLPVAHVFGTLTVKLKTEDGEWIEISKSAPGSQPIVGGQSEQENAFKGAHTDALKKAATMFGIALDLYQKPEEIKYFSAINSIWTQEAKEIFADELATIKNYFDINSIDPASRKKIIYKACQEAEMTPDNIEKIAEYIKRLK